MLRHKRKKRSGSKQGYAGDEDKDSSLNESIGSSAIGTDDDIASDDASSTSPRREGGKKDVEPSPFFADVPRRNQKTMQEKKREKKRKRILELYAQMSLQLQQTPMTLPWKAAQSSQVGLQQSETRSHFTTTSPVCPGIGLNVLLQMKGNTIKGNNNMRPWPTQVASSDESGMLSTQPQLSLTDCGNMGMAVTLTQKPRHELEYQDDEERLRKRQKRIGNNIMTLPDTAPVYTPQGGDNIEEAEGMSPVSPRSIDAFPTHKADENTVPEQTISSHSSNKDTSGNSSVPNTEQKSVLTSMASMGTQRQDRPIFLSAQTVGLDEALSFSPHARIIIESEWPHRVVHANAAYGLLLARTKSSGKKNETNNTCTVGEPFVMQGSSDTHDIMDVIDGHPLIPGRSQKEETRQSGGKKQVPLSSGPHHPPNVVIFPIVSDDPDGRRSHAASLCSETFRAPDRPEGNANEFRGSKILPPIKNESAETSLTHYLIQIEGRRINNGTTGGRVSPLGVVPLLSSALHDMGEEAHAHAVG